MTNEEDVMTKKVESKCLKCGQGMRERCEDVSSDYLPNGETRVYSVSWRECVNCGHRVDLEEFDWIDYSED